jgi:hypothetical protein
MTTAPYLLGNAPRELERLIWQDRTMFGSVTQRLLRQTGLTEGMRVLDLGSGTERFPCMQQRSSARVERLSESINPRTPCVCEQLRASDGFEPCGLSRKRSGRL